MDVGPLTWAVTLGLAAVLFAVDLGVVARRPHVPSTAECLRALAVYIGLALAFAGWLWVAHGRLYAGEFVAGWLTEYSLSVDNLFVFLLIMARFAVPRQYQQTALMIGILLALVLRGAFIAVGAELIVSFSWVFYVFGGFLVATAWRVGRGGTGAEQDYRPPRLVTWMSRLVPSTHHYHGVRLTAVEAGRRVTTPMFTVLVTIGVTDLLFAFDSIPAIFGLTEAPYLVLMTNVFALMGLRQLYFLLGALLDRLVYLNVGLAVLLAFIGVKLVLQALAGNRLPFVNGGQPVAWAPEVPIWLSLVAIVAILATTTVASLWRERRTVRARPAPAPDTDPDS